MEDMFTFLASPKPSLHPETVQRHLQDFELAQTVPIPTDYDDWFNDASSYASPAARQSVPFPASQHFNIGETYETFGSTMQSNSAPLLCLRLRKPHAIVVLI